MLALIPQALASADAVPHKKSEREVFMADHDYRWRDERRWDRDERTLRRPGGERDYRREYSEDDYGAGYGEEGLTNYRLRNASAPGGYGTHYQSYGGDRNLSGGGYPNRSSDRYDAPRDWARERQRDLGGDFSSDFGYGSSSRPRDLAEARRRWNEQQREDRGFWDRASDEVASWFGDDDAEQRRRLDARHEGRGPKGYRRSDDRIREDVSDRLTDDPFVDASDIEIQVSNAEVTLTGSVDSRNARRRAEDLSERVSGVTHVQNNLRVASGSETVREERDTKQKGLFAKS
jgi:osmotically-inducible protein OsmY